MILNMQAFEFVEVDISRVGCTNLLLVVFSSHKQLFDGDVFFKNHIITFSGLSIYSLFRFNCGMVGNLEFGI